MKAQSTRPVFFAGITIMAIILLLPGAKSTSFLLVELGMLLLCVGQLCITYPSLQRAGTLVTALSCFVMLVSVFVK